MVLYTQKCWIELKFPSFKLIYLILDVLIVFLSFLITEGIFVRLKSDEISILDSSYYLRVAYVVVFLVLLVFYFQTNGLYKTNVITTRSLQFVKIIRSILFSLLTLIVLLFIIHFTVFWYARIFLVTIVIISSLMFLIFRVLIFRKLFLFFSKRNLFVRNLIVIGAGKSGALFASHLAVNNHSGVKVIGFLDDIVQTGETVFEKLTVLGTVSDLEIIKKNLHVDEVVIAIDNIDYERLLKIIDFANKLHIPTKVSSELFQIIPERVFSESYSDIPVVDASPKIIPAVSIITKRLIDFVGAFAGLIFLLPVFVVLGILVKLSSNGPIFYSQIRIGKDGKPFKFYKFRSMTLADSDDKERQQMMIDFMKKGKTQFENETKIINTTRVTKIGRFIRKSSIDELPQLFNVLKGDMSLVGPRPCLPYEYQNYDEWHKRRVKVLPGCTGMWQVYGRENTSFKDSIVLDIYYINNMSPWLDLQILLKTIPVMVLGKGGK